MYITHNAYTYQEYVCVVYFVLCFCVMRVTYHIRISRPPQIPKSIPIHTIQPTHRGASKHAAIPSAGGASTAMLLLLHPESPRRALSAPPPVAWAWAWESAAPSWARVACFGVGVGVVGVGFWWLRGVTRIYIYMYTHTYICTCIDVVQIDMYCCVP